ncbi:hypothetical protein IW146_007676 [Coemansia sp. RSA 922]|nr:hypothetical protein IW146_007676 [Coemansia sp. RSA 922]
MWMPETATPTPSFTTRPIEPALLQCEQQLPPLAIGIACFMAGCAVTAIATRYGLVRVGKAAAAVQQVPVVKDSDATEVVADEVVADEDEANDVAAAAMQQAPVVEDSDATEVIAAGDVGTVGEVETDNMAATVVQQVPVVDDNDVENEQPMPWRRTHRGKRAGVRERARAGRRLERLSAAAGQQSDEDQVPTSAFNSNNRRN